MASIQDIESRLLSVEDRLEFVMQVMRLRQTIPLGTLDSQGRPLGQVVEGSLKDFYYEAINAKLKAMDAEVARRRFTGEDSTGAPTPDQPPTDTQSAIHLTDDDGA